MMEELLEKYYKGETSDQEEETLRQWMLKDDVPEEMKADHKLFSLLMAEKSDTVKVPDGLDQRLNALIDHLEEQEDLTKEDANEQPKKNRRLRHISLWASAVAACAVLIFGITALLKPANYIREVDNPEEASMYINMAMSQFSKAIDSGHRQMNKVGNAFEKLKQIQITK